MSKLSIVIVSWNVKDLLKKCLYSIIKHQKDLNVEVIVVDNASSDQSVEMVKQNFPLFKIIKNEENLGFAKANNQGILASNGDLILALNPDTEVMEDTLQKMVKFMEENHKVGISGCKHLNPDLTFQPSIRRFPSLFVVLLLMTKLAKLFPGNPMLYRYLALDLNHKITQEVDQVAGSFFLIRKKMLDEIGIFDENFFIWFEEVDMCKRAKNASWQVWYMAEAQIIHHGGQSFKQQLTFRNQKNFFTSAWYYLKKHEF
jgi:hypothetical protein